jgi:hypothetical protein
MTLRKLLARILVFILVICVSGWRIRAQEPKSTVVFRQAAFPTVDTSPIPEDGFDILFPGAQFASAHELGKSLAATTTGLLILPYGSAFPEECWPDIEAFLNRGGNLLVLGGRPFTRSAYREAGRWHVRDYSVRFIRQLGIDQYQDTPGSDGLEFQSSPDVTVHLPQFSWKRAFSPVIRLSSVDLYVRGGTAGSLDARETSFAWGMRDARKLAAPAIQIDHLRNRFDGGRWVFLSAELSGKFYETAARSLVRTLSEVANRGSQRFYVRPIQPLYVPGEPVELQVSWYSSTIPSAPLSVKVSIFPDAAPAQRTTLFVDPNLSTPAVVPPPTTKGLYTIEAELREGPELRAIYHSGFWIRDLDYLRSGPRLSINRDYFELDGKPLAVVGTTYMSSEVQRLFFEHPNVYIWNRDLSQIHEAGLNSIRTGWWTGWDKLCDETGQPYERTLRTLEAFLMTARKNGLPVQFNFFAFLPEVLGGVNPYMDPDALRKQQSLVAAVVARFHDVPFLAWDFINEPSISRRLWTMRPSGDPIELREWNAWLNNRYKDRATLAAVWNTPAAAVPPTVSLPDEIEFTQRGMYVGRNSLRVYDYFLFAQEMFGRWVKGMRDAVRAAGSKQLVTVGQDEGGIQDRLSPAFWGRYVDFTTNHSWWQNDFVLWDSLLAKQPGQPLLIQETGLQRELQLDESARRSLESEAALLERKIAASFIQGSGAIEWLWNTNPYMTESNETPIGAIRPDETEKPEAFVLRDFAAFAKSAQPRFRDPRQPPIAIVTSQAAQFSVLGDLQLAAQRNAVRALTYYARLTCYSVAENQLPNLGTPKLAILPSPQALTDNAWQRLLQYASNGGNLLITGPLDRDEHWQPSLRTASLHMDARTEPLVAHGATITLKDRVLSLTFDQQKQNLLEMLRFKDGSTFKEILVGAGHIYWAAYPVELAESAQPSADLYSYVARRIGLAPAFDLEAQLSPAVLVFPIELADSVMFVIVSDADENARINLRDKITGGHLAFQVPALHAAILLLDKQQKNVVARYGVKSMTP